MLILKIFLFLSRGLSNYNFLKIAKKIMISQLIYEIHKKRNSDLTKQQIAAIIDDIFDSFKISLAYGERVEIRNFGNFSIRKRDARKARNPKTGEIADVLAKSIPLFKVAKELKEIVDTK
jgi:nucleoid DNA-binding protein